MTEAEKLFNDAFLRTVAGWGTVLSFRQIAERGFHAAMQVY